MTPVKVRDLPAGFADVSVIVAAYQAADTIERTLASIAAQTTKPVEAVVVDDGSSDGTFEAAQACEPRMNGVRLRVIRLDRNQGAGTARNRAIEESSGTTLAFLDADDEWLPEKLARSMAHLEGSGYCLVAHDYWTGEGNAAQHHDCVRRFREGPDPFSALYRKGYIPSCSVVAPREKVIAAGGFDPGLRNAQDFDLWLAMTRDPKETFLVFPEPLMRYHIGEAGIMSHTQRRLRCAQEIAVRFFPDLRARPGSPWASLWFRMTALHMEAVRAYAGRRDILGVLAVAAMFPLRFASVSFQCFFFRPAPRGRFLNTNETPENG